MKRVKIKRKDLENAQNRAEFLLDSAIDLICLNEYEDLSHNQQKAQLLLFYDNEVCNGGHLQYFHNQGTSKNLELNYALKEIGADCQQKIFASACERIKANPIQQVNSLEQYHELSIEQDFEDLDMAYYKCESQIGFKLLPLFVETHFEDFVIIED